MGQLFELMPTRRDDRTDGMRIVTGYEASEEVGDGHSITAPTSAMVPAGMRAKVIMNNVASSEPSPDGEEIAVGCNARIGLVTGAEDHIRQGGGAVQHRRNKHRGLRGDGNYRRKGKSSREGPCGPPADTGGHCAPTNLRAFGEPDIFAVSAGTAFEQGAGGNAATLRHSADGA